MDSSTPTLNLRDKTTAAVIGLVFTLLFLAAAQRNPTYDGASFIALFERSFRPSLPHHPLFGIILRGFILCGRAVGAGALLSGACMAASFGGASLSLFHLLLRRHAVHPPTAIIFSALLGLNMTVLENATSIELYTPALFATLLTLHALRTATLDPSWRGVAMLGITSLLLLGFHVGFGLWVFAVYAGLAVRSGGWRDAALWLLRGAAVLATLILWLFLEGHLTEAELGKQQGFFEEFNRAGGAHSPLLILFETPLMYVACNAGLILFPAAAGAALFRRERPVEFTVACVSLFSFWAVFSFWKSDYGSFFVPLLPVLGLVSAMTVDAMTRRLGPRGRLFFACSLFFHAYLFIILPFFMEYDGRSEAVLRLLQGAFWIATAAQVVGSRFLFPAGENPLGEEPGREVRRKFLVFHGASVVLLSLLAFGPRMIDLKEPDDETLLLEAFARIAPPNARLVTHIAPHRPLVQTGRETLSAIQHWEDWEAMARNRAILTRWIRDSASDSGSPLYLDHQIFLRRDFVFGDATTGNRTEIAFDRLEFLPVNAPGQVFLRVGFKDAADRWLVGRGLDLFDVEIWDKIEVHWTRKAALLRFEPKGRYLRVKYWIGHEDISRENPLGAKIHVDGNLKTEQTHIAKDAYTSVIDLGENPTGTHELRIEFSRTWTSPDGRELGAGLYPLEFSDQP